MRALVLSGGGAYGAFQVGVLKALLRQQPNTWYQVFCGISVGAINCAHLSQYQDHHRAVSELESLWLSLVDSKVKKHWFPFSILSGIWKPSLYSTKPLQDMIRHPAKFIPEAIRRAGNKLRVGAVSLETYEYKTFTEEYPRIADAVLASSAFPIMFEPIELEGQLWADGGIKNMTPLKEAILVPEVNEIDIILCSTPFESRKRKKRPGNVLRVAQRSLEATLDEIMVTDLKVAGLINELIDSNDGYYKGKRKIKFRMFRPNGALNGEGLTFEKEDIKKNMEHPFLTF